MLSLKKNFLFVHIPKTAGNTIQDVLLEYSEDTKVTRTCQDGINCFGIVSEKYSTQKHSPLREYQQKLPEILFNNLFKFTCVRNPWDRLISFYFSPHRGKVNWDREAFIDFAQTVPPALSFLDTAASSQRSTNPIDFIIRYENLENDFLTVCNRIDIPCKSLPHLNKSNRRYYKDYYDNDLIEFVHNLFANEISLFGYTF